MKVMIMGCGRVGAWLANLLDAEGHQVTVLDLDAYSFRRLRFPGLQNDFKGTALVGNGLDEDALKRAGIEDADVFCAVTQGDNRNVMAAQIVKLQFKVPRVLCRIYDPLRQEVYATLGVEAISPTAIIAQLLREKIEGT